MFNTPQQSLTYIRKDFQDFILDLSANFLARVNQQYFAAATIDDNKIIAWFNNQQYHSAPLTLNILYNAILKASGCTDKDCSISITNNPIRYTTTSRVRISEIIFNVLLLIKLFSIVTNVTSW